MGPLAGVKIVELAGIGPAPFCAMLLSDMGAEVIRVDRAANAGRDIGREGEDPRFGLLQRGRRNIAVDLKNPEAVAAVLRLIDQADALIEGFRPGVMERLGLAPDICLARNPKLVYGRMTGWGQDGPIAHTAGHDINYIALSGALYSIGPAGGPPVPPLNLIGDFGGGALYLAMGVLAGIISARATGKGQVIDCSMVEGSASLMMMMYGALAAGAWVEQRGSNRTDGGAHYYHVYETKDGEHVAIGSIEPQFYALLLKHTGLEGETCRSRPTAPPGPIWRRGWRASSSRRPARNGPRSWSRPISASRRSCACRRRCSTSTMSIAAALSRWTASAAGAGAAFSRHAEPGAAPAGAGRRAHRRDPAGLGLFGRRDRRAAPRRGGRRGGCRHLSRSQPEPSRWPIAIPC